MSEQAASPAEQLVIAVTGHRPDKLPDRETGYNVPNPTYDIVVKGLVDAFEYYKPAYVISGMALGVDQWAAEICVNMDIPFVAALPFRGQESKWIPKSKAHYFWLLSKAYAQYVICEGGYEAWKMQKRNEWMIASCHMVVAVYNGDPSGGTFNCLTAAAAAGKYIHYVPIPSKGMTTGEFFEKMYGSAPQTKLPQPTVEVPGTKRIVEL